MSHSGVEQNLNFDDTVEGWRKNHNSGKMSSLETYLAFFQQAKYFDNMSKIRNNFAKL